MGAVTVVFEVTRVSWLGMVRALIWGRSVIIIWFLENMSKLSKTVATSICNAEVNAAVAGAKDAIRL